ncbi:MAG: TRAP transporter small permease [Candidatus Adiutrix sp.]
MLYQTYLRVLAIIENTIMAAGLAVMLTITFANIIGRKFLNTSWAFTEEITSSLFLLVTLVGAAAAARRGCHLGLSLLTDLLPPKAQKASIIFSGLAGITLSVMLVIFGFEMVLGEIAIDMRTAALGWPEWWFGMFVPIGGALMGLEFLNFTIMSIFKKTPKEGN